MNLESSFHQSRLQPYLDSLKANHTSSATIERKISSLNSFQNFLIKKGYLKPNPNPTLSLNKARAPLSRGAGRRPEGFEPKKGFLSRYLIFGTLIAIILGLGYGLYTQTILKAKQELAYSTATAPVRAGRVLSFQGRLTDTSGNPISSSTSIIFKFYNDGVGGTELYSSGIGSTITPDENGIFSVVIGKSHGTEISPDVFTENPEVWLEITADSETMDPRQQIATVAYAVNAETLQGMPPSASGLKDTVLVIDSQGNLNLGETSPTIKSISGTMAVEGQALLLKASDGSGGNITINPDGNGTIRFLTEGTSPNIGGFVDFSNANIASGNLINSQINNDNLGYNFVSLQNYNTGTTELSTRFSVGASGNVYISNSLNAGGIITFTGLPTGTGSTVVYIDSSGNLASGALPAGTVYTASNGITMVASDFQIDPNYSNNWLTSQYFSSNVGITGDLIVDGTFVSVGSTSLVSNLNAQYLGGIGASDFLQIGQTGSLPYVNDAYTDATLTRYGTGPYTLGLNLANANIWTADQTFNNVGIGGTLTLPQGATNGYILSSDASGNSSWIAPSSVGGTITADNGLHMSGTVVGLGGSLNSDTRLNIGNTEVLFLKYSNGFVGIGTTSPTQKLDVNGAVNIGGSLALGSIDFTTDNNRVLTSSATGSGTLQYLDTTNWDKSTADDYTYWVAKVGNTVSNISTGNTLTFTPGTGIGATFAANNITFNNTGLLSLNTLTGNLTLAGGTDVSIIAVGNTLQIHDTSTLQTVTNRGATTTNQITINYAGAPFVLSSGNTTTVTNLSADLLDGRDSTYFVNIGQTGSLPYVNNATDSTLTRSGTGPYTLALNLGSTNVWTALQTFSAGVTASALAVGGTVTFTNLPLGTGTTILYIDSAGVVTQGSLSATSYTASNGVTLVGNDFQLNLAYSPTWTGVHTFNAIPAFNGGTPGSSAPFTVDSTYLVSSLNADLLDGLSSNAFLQVGGTGFFNTATNGLQAIGVTGIGLGGTLTQNTNINLASYNLSFLGLGNTQSLFIGSNGNVGIGTTEPGAKLDISTSTSGVQTYLRLTNTGAFSGGEPTIDFYNSAGELTTAQIGSFPGAGYNVSVLKFSVADSSQNLQERMRIDISGNVGIGTTNPQSRLHIYDDSVPTEFRLQYADITAYITNNYDYLSTNIGNANMTMQRISGNVGIGTTNPLQKLDVNGSVNIGGSLALGSIASTIDNNRVLTSSVAGSGIVQYLDTSDWDKSSTNDISVATNGLQLIGTTAVGLGGTLTQAGFTTINSGTGSSGIAFTVNRLVVGVTGYNPNTNYNRTTPVAAGTILEFAAGDYQGASNALIYTSNLAGVSSLTLDPGNGPLLYLNGDNNFVGIGTTDPSSLLSVNGTISAKLYQDIENPLTFLDLNNTSYNSTSLSLLETGSLKWNAKYNAGWQIINAGYYASKIENYTNGLLLATSIGSTSANGDTITSWNTNLFLAGNGNVGIGTTSPNGLLALNNGTGQASLLTYAANTSATWNQNIINGYYSPNGSPYIRYFDLAAVGRSDDGVNGASVIRFLTNPATLNSAATEKMRIDGNGNVGIGTTNPLYNLHVVGSGYFSTTLNVGSSLGVTGTITSGLINGQTISAAANFTGTLVAATSLSAPRLISTVAIGTAPLTVTSTTKVANLNVDFLDGYQSGNASGNIPISNGTLNTNLNADLLDGYHGASASTINTYALRDASGDINARLFRSEYDTTNATIGYIMTQVDTVANNYIRPSTPAQVLTGLGLNSGGTADIWVDEAGDTMTGVLNANAGISQDGNVVLNGTDTWLRTTGATGWYSSTYAVGVYATATGRVDIYNGGGLYVPGNVGIGTEAPGYKLDVNGTLHAAGTATLNDVSATDYVLSGAPGSFSLSVGNGDGATLTTATADIKTWYGFGIIGMAGNPYGNGTRTIVFNGRNGDITTRGQLTLDGNAQTTIAATGGYLNFRGGPTVGGFFWCKNSSLCSSVLNTNRLAFLTTGGALTIQGALTQNTVPDIAENIKTNDSTIEAGDIVVADTPAQNADIYERAAIKKADTPYGNKIIGAISSDPGILLNAKGVGERSEIQALTPDQRPLTLSGRIPLKISNVNGPIKTGDPITSSSIPGIGMRATKSGTIVAKALEEFDETQASSCLDNPQYLCGKILAIVNISWYDPDVFLSDTGQVAINYNVSDEVLAKLGYSGTKNEIEAATYSLTDSAGNAVTRVGQFGKLAAAKIETAYLSAKSILVDNLAAKKIASETIITGDITGTEALFDSATIGSLTADSIGASEASFSTVYADQIINPEGNISDVLASKISSLRDEIKSMIASSSAEATPSAIALESSTWDTSLPAQTAELLAGDNITLSDSLVIGAQLTVNGHSSLNTASVTGTLTVGQIAFKDNLIETTAEALYIQPSGLGSVHILNDRLVLSSDGSVTVNGNLNVTGSLIAEMIKAESVETKNLTAEKINIASPAQTAELSAGAIIASPEPAEGATTSATLASNATVGTITLAAGQTEITIANPRLTPSSMVYLTPSGSTGNQVVYIKSKSVVDPNLSPTPSAFTIAIDQPLAQNVDINWWLIN